MPLFTYGGTLFEGKLGHVRIQNKLNSIRGLAAKTITGAYVSTSTEAAALLANIPPIDQLILEAIDTKRHRSSLDINKVGNLIPAVPRLSKKALKERLRERTLIK